MPNKTPKGGGSFRERPDGSWEYTVSVGNDIYGKRRRKSFYGDTQSECLKKHKKFLKEGDKTLSKPQEHTLSGWIDNEWLPIYKSKKVQVSTYKDYINLASHVKKHKIGGMKLSQVKPIHVTEFFTDIDEFSKSFRGQMRFLLNGAFECAIDNDFCTKNPVKRAEIAKKRQPEKEYFTEDEARAIVDFATTDNLFGLPVYIMLKTGIRGQEMRALTRSKIDFDKGSVLIDKAVKQDGKLGLPKNNKPRVIPISTEVAVFLKSKIPSDTKYIVGNDDYTTYDNFKDRYEAFFKRLNKFLTNAELEPISVKPSHCLRHTASTLWQAAGMPRELVAELLGHADVSTTAIYTHTQLSTLRRAIEQYDFSNVMADWRWVQDFLVK
jgi:integrase